MGDFYFVIFLLPLELIKTTMKSLDPYLHPMSPQNTMEDVKLNNPFEYRPSPLITEAQQELISEIEKLQHSDPEVAEELSRGKMFGVMVVRSEDGGVGYLAAFSGCMAGRLELDNFVPPISGRRVINSHFEAQDQAIGAIGKQINELKNSPEYVALEGEYNNLKEAAEREIKAANDEYLAAKTRRDRFRKESTDPSIIASLQRESQHQKGEIKRLEKRLKEGVTKVKQRFQKLQDRLSEMVDQRRKMSHNLQKEMFESYRVVNGRGEWRSLYKIFDDSLKRLPPSGAGECAAPKLLHYALTNKMKPIALGEFWYGNSPKGEVRHHAHFYGACQSRCYPILTFMLEGVDVAEIEPELIREAKEPLTSIFEDEHIVIFNKPSGLLSVAGRYSTESVASIARERYPEATGSIIVHRLDQETSGILVVTKSAEVHKALQRQFSERRLSKRYIAIVEGVIKVDSGDIRLPMVTNIYDRPRQMVDYEIGKAAHTTFEVLERGDNFTRLSLTPHTGRTHQLRLHCAHPDGLNAPIRGDRLYGEINTRLHLHAEEITFTHPVTEKVITVKCEASF